MIQKQIKNGDTNCFSIFKPLSLKWYATLHILIIQIMNNRMHILHYSLIALPSAKQSVLWLNGNWLHLYSCNKNQTKTTVSLKQNEWYLPLVFISYVYGWTIPLKIHGTKVQDYKNFTCNFNELKVISKQWIHQPFSFSYIYQCLQL